MRRLAKLPAKAAGCHSLILSITCVRFVIARQVLINGIIGMWEATRLIDTFIDAVTDDTPGRSDQQ